MYWNEKFECMPEEELKQLQLQYLKEVTAWVYERVPAYKAKFDEKGVVPADIKSLDDVVKLPFTIKSDLRDNYPFGFLAVPMNEVFRIHASSGTTGKSTTTAFNSDDMQQWGECVARTIFAPGIRPGDMVQVAFGYGLFTGGLGFQLGSEHLGCTVVPAGAGMTERQMLDEDAEGGPRMGCRFCIYNTSSDLYHQSRIAANRPLLGRIADVERVTGRTWWMTRSTADIAPPPQARYGQLALFQEASIKSERTSE